MLVKGATGVMHMSCVLSGGGGGGGVYSLWLVKVMGRLRGIDLPFSRHWGKKIDFRPPFFRVPEKNIDFRSSFFGFQRKKKLILDPFVWPDIDFRPPFLAPSSQRVPGSLTTTFTEGVPPGFYALLHSTFASAEIGGVKLLVLKCLKCQ